MTMTMTTCPECNGVRVTLGYACPGFRPLTLPCSFCKGEGSVSDERLRWRAEGERLRTERMSRDWTLRECAKQIGVGAADLSDAERGRTDPAPMVARFAERSGARP